MNRILGFDLETTGLDPFAPGARILCGTLGPASWVGPTIPTRLRDVAWMPEHTLVGHNLAFDLAWLSFEPSGQLFDTMVAQHRLDENAPNSLEATAQRWLGEGKLLTPDAWEEADDAMLAYNQRDAELCERLHPLLSAALREQGLWSVFERDMRLLRVLVRMRRRGVNMDWQRLEESRMIVEQRTREALAEIRAIDPDLNPRSGKDLGRKLYAPPSAPHPGDMGLPVLVKTKPSKTHPQGQRAVSREALLMVRPHATAEQRRLIDAVLQYRNLDKLGGGFLSKLPEHRGADGRIHAAIHLGRGGKGNDENGTVSGRLSSSNPNMQQLPKKDKLVRACVIPSRGLVFTRADYSQVELRIAGWLSGDPTMRGIFARGEDFHTATLAKLERVPYQVATEAVAERPEWRTKRDACKRVNFGSIYGAYPKKIWSVAVADGFTAPLSLIEKIWFEQRRIFAHFWAWAGIVGQMAARDGHVLSPLGIHRRFPGLTSAKDHATISRAQRQAINHLVQNTAAEIMLYALLYAEEELEREQAGSLLLTVHDELLVEHPAERTADVGRILLSAMKERPTRLIRDMGLPDLEHLNLNVEISAGLTSWAG